MKRILHRSTVPKALLCAALGLTIGACSSVPGDSGPNATEAPESLDQATPERQTVASVALDQVGKPYAANMAGPAQYDATGLTYYAFRQNGRALPRSLQAQMDAGTPIELARAAPGDLLFYRLDTSDGRGQLTVALLVDSNAAVIVLRGSADQGGGVKQIDISADYWQRRMVGISRLLPRPDGSASGSSGSD